MRISKKFSAVAGSAVAALALAVGGAGAASAASQGAALVPIPGGPGGPGGVVDNCTGSGIYAGYCGTQRSGGNLYIAVNRNGQVVGETNPRPGSDEFLWFADAGATKQTGGDNYMEFAPYGDASGKVLAVVHKHVVLAPASGATDQKWVPTAGGLKNVGSGDILETNGNNNPLLAVTGTPSGPTETWTYVSA
jgi:hypothetical protein